VQKCSRKIFWWLLRKKKKWKRFCTCNFCTKSQTQSQWNQKKLSKKMFQNFLHKIHTEIFLLTFNAQNFKHASDFLCASKVFIEFLSLKKFNQVQILPYSELHRMPQLPARIWKIFMFIFFFFTFSRDPPQVQFYLLIYCLLICDKNTK
jgi:hypothetical protein